MTLLFAAFFVLQANAQNFEEAENNMYPTQEFGAHIGAVTGVGLSYRQRFGNTGMQATFLPFKAGYTEFYSMGLSGL